ncbi:MAG: 50S ribosomal protein L11 methyltransferase [Variibacter sp.]|nr:50S ribosomal protein L11 methyltransferase [Variibacter sp.]
MAGLLGEMLDMDAASVSVFEADRRWSVAIHCAAAPDLEALRALIVEIAGAEAAAGLEIEKLARQDWVAASLAGLSPVRAGRFFIHGAHDRARVPPNAVPIEVEAALAFGTGHHGTTRGCLLALDRLLKARRPRRVLDVGTGTGVLAIAAAKAARRPVLASDIDRQAARIARANARANGVGAFVETIQANGLRGRRFRERAPYDLLLANILLGPLQRLAVPVARLTAPGGCVVLSGLLAGQVNAALAAYRPQGLALARRLDLEGWATVVLTRRSRPRNAKAPRR